MSYNNFENNKKNLSKPEVKKTEIDSCAQITDSGIHDFPTNMVVMIEHKAFSTSFNMLYKRGMRLLDEASNYLNGEGKKAMNVIPTDAVALYSGEAMRLSARLMQAASWLLLERAAREEDMSIEDIKREKKKVFLNMEEPQDTHPAWSSLPAIFRHLIEESERLIERIRYLDTAHSQTGNNGFNPVKTQLQRLRKAVGDI